MTLEYRRGTWHELGRWASYVRTTVFVEEQAVPRELEWDDRDADATHWVALTRGGEPIGTARLLPDHHIGRMAVLRAHRGQGVGRALLQHIIDHAAGERIERLHLAAQLHAIPFYEHLGFAAGGPVFLDAGIEHRMMERCIIR